MAPRTSTTFAESHFGYGQAAKRPKKEIQNYYEDLFSAAQNPPSVPNAIKAVQARVGITTFWLNFWTGVHMDLVIDSLKPRW